MDTALPELGPGIKPDDRPVWGTADPVFIKEKTGTPHPIKRAFQSYASNISSIARNIRSHSGGRVWAVPTYSFAANVCLLCKKFQDYV